jgi:hypothetical protein
MAKRKAMKLTTEIKEVANPDRWNRTHGTYIAGRASIDGVDAVAVEMERYWGVDRLRLLVPPELREKFDRQRYLFNAAIQNGDLEAVRVQSARMITAWMVCNKVAIDAGAKHLPLEVIEVGLDDGTVAAIVPDAQRAELVQREGRAITIYTHAEIAHLLMQYALVAKVKVTFPGATVVAARQKGDPLRGIDSPTGLDTPFDDGVPSLMGGRS